MPITPIEKTYSDVKIGPDEPVEYKEFPRMIYHVIEGRKIVETKEELDAHLEAGWSKTPIKLNEIAILDARIAETEVVLKDLKAKRKAMVAQKQRDEEAIEKCQP
jgi:hypothetical protein